MINRNRIHPIGVGLIFLFYLFLYMPIVVLIVFSFNAGGSGHLTTWTLKWYKALFHAPEILHTVKNSFIVAISTVILSITMGLALVVASARARFNKLSFLFYATLAIPEIVIAVGLLSFYYFFSIPLGLVALIVAHTLIGLGYVVPTLYERIAQVPYTLTEASLDLGASHIQTFFYVTLPLLKSSLITTALLVFIVSFEDFSLAFFCASAESQTLPLYLFSLIRAGSAPLVNALSSFLLLMTGFFIFIFCLFRKSKVQEMK